MELANYVNKLLKMNLLVMGKTLTYFNNCKIKITTGYITVSWIFHKKFKIVS